MPSHLRLQSSFEEPIEAHATYQPTTQRPAKKQKMSLTATYFVASTARTKLGKEAGRADHDLRLLVGHANLLDQLMIDLADAERESENWLNQSIREASKPEEPRRVQWMDNAAVDFEDEESDDESDDGSELDDEEMFSIPPRIKSAPITISSAEVDEDAEYDEESEEEELALTRVSSNQLSPPELTLDDDSDSEDDDYDVPASPEDALLQLSEKQRQAIATTAFYDYQSEQGIDDFLQAQQPLIAAC